MLLNDYVLILVLSLCVYTAVKDMPINIFIRPNSQSLRWCFREIVLPAPMSLPNTSVWISAKYFENCCGSLFNKHLVCILNISFVITITDIYKLEKQLLR